MDAEGTLFGAERLSEACCQDRRADLSYNLRELLEAVGRYRGPKPVLDDLSALALEIKGA